MYVPSHPAGWRFFRAKISIRLESNNETEATSIPESLGSLGKFKSTPVSKSKIRRGKGKRKHNGENINRELSIWGNNSNGLKAKLRSLRANLEQFDFPSCVTLQETKLRQTNLIKIEGYKVFETVRTGLGGGLLTAVIEELEPVLISEGEDDAEILVVQIKVGNQSIRIINCYGPQEDEDSAVKINFWKTLENEIISAYDHNCLILVQMDANAKVGVDVIKGDPHKQSENGYFLMEMLKRQNLSLLNGSDQCKGTITRHRKTINGEEKSILDYILVCQGLLGHFVEMFIDEERLHTLTKYATTKGNKSKV